MLAFAILLVSFASAEILIETQPNDVYNLGDSRMILCKKSEAHVVTKDHKPNWPDEQTRIEKIGGKIYFDGFDWRIGDLSVSRAFGDLDNSPYISCKPDIFRYKI